MKLNLPLQEMTNGVPKSEAARLLLTRCMLVVILVRQEKIRNSESFLVSELGWDGGKVPLQNREATL